MTEKPTYDESNIRLLKPNEHIRLRPGMYFGGTDKTALCHILEIAIDEAVNEALNGYANQICITLRPDNELSIQHDGRGLITSRDYGINVLEHMMTYRGSPTGDRQYAILGGVHGVQIGAVNAMSSECKVEITYDGSLLRQSYRAGIPQTEVIEIRQLDEGEPTGMTITFRPDFTILEPNDIGYELLLERSREVAYLLPNLTITLRDERSDTPRQDEFHFANGLADYVAYLNRDKTVLHDPISGNSEWTIRPHDRAEYKVAVDVAYQYTEGTEFSVIGYVNTVRTTGGFHTELFSLAMSTGHRSPDEILPGLIAVVSVRHPRPSFQTMADLTLLNSDVISVMFQAVIDARYSANRYKGSLPNEKD
jgi:DNA gyrase/topoisomerase IV subunit B